MYTVVASMQFSLQTCMLSIGVGARNSNIVMNWLWTIYATES